MKKFLLFCVGLLALALSPLGAQQTYTLTFTSNGNGTVSGYNFDSESAIESGTALPDGTWYQVTATPDEGYEFDYFIMTTKSSSSTIEVNQIMGAIESANVVIEAFFKQASTTPRHLISISHGEFGTVNGEFKEPDETGWEWRYEFDVSKQILAGTEVTLTATPYPNYVVDTWTYNGTVVEPEADAPNVYKFTVTEEANIYVTFKRGVAGSAVNYSAGENGIIKSAIVYMPDGLKPFTSGDKFVDGLELEFTAEPNEGYEVDQWFVNDVADTRYDGQNIFQTNVQGNMDIRVTFKKSVPSSYPVFYSCENGGMLLAKYSDVNGNMVYPQSGDQVPVGTEVTFWINLSDGFAIDSWYINGAMQSVPEGQTEITHVINEETTVQVVCKPVIQKVTINLTHGEFGTVVAKFQEPDETGWVWNYEFDRSKEIATGTEVSVIATPYANYVVDTWTYNGTVVEPEADAPNIYKFIVTEEATIHVTFKKGVAGSAVTYSAGENGIIKSAIVYMPDGLKPFTSGDKLVDGLELEFTAEPNEGYEVDQWFVNDVADTRYDGQNIFQTNVQGNMDVKVTFKKSIPSSYPVFYSCENGGMLLAKYSDANGNMVYPQSGDQVPVGTEVTFWINLSDGFDIDSWIINGETQADLAGKKEFTYIIDKSTNVEAICKKAGPISTISSADVRVFLVGDQLVVEGLSAPTKLTIFDASGQLLIQQENAQGSVDISTLGEGIYFVHLSDKTFKIIK